MSGEEDFGIAIDCFDGDLTVEEISRAAVLCTEDDSVARPHKIFLQQNWFVVSAFTFDTIVTEELFGCEVILWRNQHHFACAVQNY
jgi:hypothetical protein